MGAKFEERRMRIRSFWSGGGRVVKSAGLISLGLVLLMPTLAHAVRLTITNRVSTGGSAAAQNALADAIETQFNSVFFAPTLSDDFLQAMGNAGAVSGRSLIADPVSEMESFSVSGAGSFALATPRRRTNSESKPVVNGLPGVGVGAQLALTVGVPAKRLGWNSVLGLDANRTDVFGSIMSLNLDNVIPGTRWQMTNLGAGFRYTWVDPGARSILGQWTGVSLLGGLQFVITKFSYQTPLRTSVTDSTYTVSYNAVVDLGVDSTVLTAPVSVVTGYRLLNFWTWYTGFGLDLNTGKSDFTGTVSGPVVGVDGGNTQVYSATGTFDASSTEGVRPIFLNARFLLGTQLELWALKLFAQFDRSTPNTTAFTFGLRAVF